MATQSQEIPVRIYDRDEHMILAAPLPGLEPEDISVMIAGNKVTIRGEERGPRQHESGVLVDEWTIGPYFREVTIPQGVNGSLTNATYGNGVLVLSMPKRKEGEAASDASFQLHPIAATRGERIGHTGSDIRPAAMSERGKKHESEKNV
jgi:HSP20 family protein